MSCSSEDSVAREELESVDIQPYNITQTKNEKQSKEKGITEETAEVLKKVYIQDEEGDDLEVVYGKDGPLPQAEDIQLQVENSDSEASVHQRITSGEDNQSEEKVFTGVPDLLKEVCIQGELLRPEDAGAHTSSASDSEDDDDKPIIEILEVQGRVVHVLGTAHVSKKSCLDVSEVIQRVRPQVSFCHAKITCNPTAEASIHVFKKMCHGPVHICHSSIVWSGKCLPGKLYPKIPRIQEKIVKKSQTKRHESKTCSINRYPHSNAH
jgi:hypothetical protein